MKSLFDVLDDVGDFSWKFSVLKCRELVSG